MTTTILTIDKLHDITPITKSLADNVDMLITFIEVSEEMHVREILGDALYSDIITNIENGTLSGNNQTLVEKYLYNLSSWYTFLEAAPFILYKPNAKGITKQFSDNSQSIDKDEFAIFRQSISEKATYWRTTTVAFLNKNKLLYPLWRDTNTNPINNSFDTSNGIYL